MRVLLKLILLFFVAFGGIAPAFAQNEPQDEVAESSTDGNMEVQEAAEEEAPARPVLDEVIVTARKRAEDVQDIPLSVTAIGGEEMKLKNMADLNDLDDYAPNLEISSTPSFSQIYMRGLGSDLNAGFEQSVAILVDEVYYGRPSYLSNALLDLAAVEVLRGPQGTLFGKNASAGAIHLRTADPSDEWSLDADAKLGEDEALRFRLAGGGPLTDDIFWRVAVMSDVYNGFVRNTTLNNMQEGGFDRRVVRLKVKWQASADISLMASGNLGFTDQGGNGAQHVYIPPRHLAAMREFDPQTSGDGFDEKNHQNYPGGTERMYYDVGLRADWDTGRGFSLTSVTNYAAMDEDIHLDADMSPIPYTVLEAREEYQQITQEFRITSDPGEFEYVAGIFGFANDIYNEGDINMYLEFHELVLMVAAAEALVCNNAPPELQPLFGPILGTDNYRKACQDTGFQNEEVGRATGALIKARTDNDIQLGPVEQWERVFDQQAQSVAAFGQFTWNIDEAWSVTAGGRISYETKELYYDHALINSRTGIRGDGAPINLFLEPNDRFVPGGAMSVGLYSPGVEDFKETRSREEFKATPMFSTKYNWTDDLMMYLTLAQGYKAGGFNAAADSRAKLEFEGETSNTAEAGLKSEWFEGAARLNIGGFYTQFDDLQVSAFNGSTYQVSNAASATVYGIEWETMLVPFWGLFLNANGAWTQGTYDEYTQAACVALHQSPPPCDLSGESLARLAEWQATISATWDRQFFNFPFNLHLGASGKYRTTSFHSVDNDPFAALEGGWMFDGRIGLRGLDGNWHILAFIDNLANREQLVGSEDAPGIPGAYFGGRMPLTNVEVEVRITF